MIVGAVIILLVVGVSNIGPIIKKAVNTYGPNITKTQVELGDVDVSLLSTEAKLKDFILGNPEGFKSPQAITKEAKKQLEDASQSAKNEVKATTDNLKGIFGK